jgi:hypothetical protein
MQKLRQTQQKRRSKQASKQESYQYTTICNHMSEEGKISKTETTTELN